MQALRAFEAAARFRSLTRAAESLHLTHGAISHQIKALEEELGVALVERAGRGIRLTDAGERLAARVRLVFDELHAALREARERANPRRLRVTTMPSFAARWLLPRIGRFIRAHPDIDLDVSASEAVVDLAREEVDVAIRYGLGHWPGLHAEFLHDDEFFPVASPRLVGRRPRMRPEDLARFPLMRAEDEPWRPWFEAAGLDWPEPDRGPMFNDSGHLMQAAIAGQGVALARRVLLGDDLDNGLLVRLSDISVPTPRQFWFVCLPRDAGAPKIAALRDWLRDEFARADAARPPPEHGRGRITPSRRR
jgi:LysR family glycine cleavage system transcriptional activator